MTAGCPGGVPQIRPQSPAEVFLTSEGASAMLVALFGVESAFADLIVFVVGQTIIVSSLCSNDPPALPVFSATDIVDIFASFPGSNRPGFLKLIQLAEYLAWYTYCECSAGSPIPIQQPVYPTGAPVGSNPGSGNLPQPNLQPCFTYVDPFTYTYGNGIGVVIGSGSTNWSGKGVTSLLLKTTSVPISGSGSTMTLSLQQNSGRSSPAMPPPTVFGIPSGSPSQISISLDPNYSSATITSTVVGTTGQSNLNLEWDYYCGSPTPGGPLQDCCPPDPNLTFTLQQISNMLQFLISSVPAPVNSFAESTVHSGLTGSGSFGINSTSIAIKVQLTTIPGWIGQEIGSPTFYFDVGFVAFTTIEGSYSSNRLTFAQQVFSVPLLGYTIDYTLLNGVVATITELTRGP